MDILEKIAKKIGDEAKTSQGEVPSLRPILFIGVGGFGCSIVRKLKRRISHIAPAHKDGFAYLGLDTHPAPADDILGKLEYVPLSLGVHPNTVARTGGSNLAWYRELVGAWKARNINTGADKVRAVGRLAFRHSPTFADFLTKLRGAISKINKFRQNFNLQEIPKVYIISTLAGGTGSGSLLDIFTSVSHFMQTSFGANYKLQSLIVTPDALQGEAPENDFPEFYANTYATLKEIHHFIAGGETITQFDDAQYSAVSINQESIPDPLFLVTDQNEARKPIVDNFDQLADMLTSYLLCEIRTPIKDESGQPKPQDKENPNFDEKGKQGAFRAFSSLGVAQVGFPFEEVCDVAAYYLISDTINSELKASDGLLDVDDWIVTAGLTESGSDQLQQEVRKEKDGRNMRISIDIEGPLKDIKSTELLTECKKLKEYKCKSLEEQKIPLLDENEKQIIDKSRASLESTVEKIYHEKNLGTALSFLRAIKEKLIVHQTALQCELGNGKNALANIEKECQKEIETIGLVVKSGIIGRKGRISAAISSFGGHLGALLNKRLDVYSMEKGLNVYVKLISASNNLLRHWESACETLSARAALLMQKVTDKAIEINRMADINQRGPGNRFSLVDFQRVLLILKEYFQPREKQLMREVCQEWKKRGFIKETHSKPEDWIRSALHDISAGIQACFEKLNFERILDMFYPEDQDKKNLFQDLSALASPLFPVDPNRKEAHYSTYWIIATHPDIKQRIVDNLSANYLAGEGRMHAPFNNPYEIIIYSIKHGYTLYSLSSLDQYYSHYSKLQEAYETSQKKGEPARAVHAWEQAHLWDEINPIYDEEDIYKSFALGWAFGLMFPSHTKPDGMPDDRRNRAYIYQRGAFFYMTPLPGHLGRERKEVKIGQGLESALKAFYGRQDWVKYIDEQIEKKVDEIGTSSINNRLEAFIPVLEEKIEAAKNSRDFQRERALLCLKDSLLEFIKKIST